MSELVERARQFATKAHRQIGHRRKYTGEPYEVHLDAVARTVASVTDDPEMIAAAWLHDVVEDTPTTLEDIEREFGQSVAALVVELTDVSCLADGNRAVRKGIDRRHTSAASPRAKTIKLADVIDNCEDFIRHAPGFLKTFLPEMAQLLAVLEQGDLTLFRRAKALHENCVEQIRREPTDPSEPVMDDGR